jgi:translation initiation factor 6
MPFKFLKSRFNGDPNIGLYGFATESYCLLGIRPQHLTKLEETLKVRVATSTVAGTELIGLFAAGNKNGILLPKIADEHEIKAIEKATKVHVSVIESNETALGNLIVCNDKGCLIPDKLKRFKRQIEDALDCEVAVGNVAGLDIIGSVNVANNNGCLCHIDANEEQMKRIGEVLKVKTDVGTAGFGSPFIKASLIVNSNGVAFSDMSTGPEIGRFEEVFS